MTCSNSQEKKPSIVKFADGKYGIRKRILFIPVYLGIIDIRHNSNVVNWRAHISSPPVYNWCTTGSITEANSVLKILLDKNKKVKVKPSAMTEDEINKELLTERLKGNT